MKHHIHVYGPTGSGKSLALKFLAEQLGVADRVSMSNGYGEAECVPIAIVDEKESFVVVGQHFAMSGKKPAKLPTGFLKDLEHGPAEWLVITSGVRSDASASCNFELKNLAISVHPVSGISVGGTAIDDIGTAIRTAIRNILVRRKLASALDSELPRAQVRVRRVRL